MMMSTSKTPPCLMFFRPTKHDFSAALAFACAVLGIGALAMGRNFGRAGIIPATTALFLMFAINCVGSMLLSRIMLSSPSNIHTYGDLGQYAMGSSLGKYVVIGIQFGTCLLIPIAFLVLLGTTILPNLLKDIWPNATPNMYIPLIALVLLPVILIRTLKEATWASVLGTAGAFFGVVLAVVDSYMNGSFYQDITPEFSLVESFGVFGSMALSFGGAVLIPAIQREHPQPERMPTIIFVVLLVITMCYLVVGVLGYVQYGCVAPVNLLETTNSRSVEVAAMLLFLMHIGLALPVYLQPAFYLFERAILYNKKTENDCYTQETGGVTLTMERASSSEEEESPYSLKQRLGSYGLRSTVLTIQVFIAMLAQNSFDDLADFVGSSCVACGGIVLPIILYWRMYGHTKSMSIGKKILAVATITLTLATMLYTSYHYLTKIIDKASQFELFSSGRSNTVLVPPTDHDLLTDRNEFCIVKE